MCHSIYTVVNFMLYTQDISIQPASKLPTINLRNTVYCLKQIIMVVNHLLLYKI